MDIEEGGTDSRVVSLLEKAEAVPRFLLNFGVADIRSAVRHCQLIAKK
jgi:hypothetical protein